MSLTYQSISKHPVCFRSLTGVELSEFIQIVDKVRPLYMKMEKSKKISGRPSGFKSLEDKVLCLIMYYRTYITHTFLGYLFGLHNANICRMFKVLEPMIAQTIKITKDRTLTKDKVLAILADATEVPTQRPSKKQKEKYSGKKKRHTLKSEISMQENGRIIGISKVYGGSVHDFTIRTKEKPFAPEPIKLVDSGYQGLQRRQSNVLLPFKGSKKKPLDQEKKKDNKAHASLRVPIENKISELKIFKIISGIYRNFQKKFHMRLNIIAGIINLRHGF